MVMHGLLLAALLALPSPTPLWSSFDDAPQKQADKKHEQDMKHDVETGAKYPLEIEKELKFSKNQEYIDRVNRVGGEMAEIAKKNQVKVTWGDKRLNPFEYRFHVVEDKNVNAFSIPGGFIYVNEGLLKFVESDDELAGVLAHEIGHAAFRHLATMQRENQKLNTYTLPLILAAILSGGKAGADVAAGTQLFTQAKASGWHEAAELSSDFGGLQYMLKSKYNPTGLLTFMERLARKDAAMETIDWGIYRTHPPSKHRAEVLTAKIIESGRKVERSKVTTSFSAQLKKQPDGRVEAWFSKRLLHTFGGPNAMARAENAATKLNAFFDDTPEMYEISIKPDGSVVGKGRLLFTIEPEDAVAADVALPKMQETTGAAIKASVSYLSSMIWLAR